jgi:hypothetical protein
MSDRVERFSPGSEIVPGSKEVPRKMEVSRMIEAVDGGWVRYSDHRSVVERLEGELEKAEDRFEFCDNCQRPSREEDLKTIWCRDAESGEQVDARICLVCRLEAERDQAVERRREIESKLESGYAFCHPESDCEGLRRAFATTALIHKAIEEFEERAEDESREAVRKDVTQPYRERCSARSATLEEATSFLRDQLSSLPEHQAEGRDEESQTLRGLATWLVSLDEPGSVDRRTITLAEIIHQAELALEGKER